MEPSPRGFGLFYLLKVPEDALLSVSSDKAGLEVLEINVVRRIIQQRQQQITFIAQGLLGPLAPGDVFLDRQKVRDFAGGIENGRNGGRLPVKFAVFFAVLKLATPRFAAGDAVPQFLIRCGKTFTRF